MTVPVAFALTEPSKSFSERARGTRTMDQIREAGAERTARWNAMLQAGVYATRAELARGEGVSRAAVTKALGASIE